MDKGMLGDAMNAYLCGAGHNLRKMPAWIRLCLYKWAKTWVQQICMLCFLPFLHPKAT